MELVHNQDKNQEYRKAARKLVAQMDLREKCSQTLNWASAVDRLNIKAYNWQDFRILNILYMKQPRLTVPMAGRLSGRLQFRF